MTEDSETNNPSSDAAEQGRALPKPPPEEERRLENRRFLEEDRATVALRGFGIIGIIAMVIILSGNMLFVPLSGILVLVWAWVSKTPWRDLGLVRPNNWIGTIALGVGFGVVLKFVMKSIVMPLLGAPPVIAGFFYLVLGPLRAVHGARSGRQRRVLERA